MQSALEDIFNDEDLTEDFDRAEEDHETDGYQRYNPYEHIPEPDRRGWPTFNDIYFPQEHKITGFRSWSITLSELFPLSLRPMAVQVTGE
ncbi:hypothetical protein ATCC90586_008641 [Pythium insidiosum]|nr:hypothetical protein ATCC90586_008641 [Pythium insidiosum]